MSDERYFIADTIVRREVKKVVYKLPTSQNSEAFSKHRPFLLFSVFLFMNFSVDDLLKQFFYIQNRNMCLNKEILYQYFVDFCPAWDSSFSEHILYVIA